MGKRRWRGIGYRSEVACRPARSGRHATCPFPSRLLPHNTCKFAAASQQSLPPPPQLPPPPFAPTPSLPAVTPSPPPSPPPHLVLLLLHRPYLVHAISSIVAVFISSYLSSLPSSSRLHRLRLVPFVFSFVVRIVLVSPHCSYLVPVFASVVTASSFVDVPASIVPHWS